MGTNDLASLDRIVVHDKLTHFIHLLLVLPTVKYAVWCMVIPRASHVKNAHQFNASAAALNGLMVEGLAPFPNILVWRHARFSPDKKMY